MSNWLGHFSIVPRSVSFESDLASKKFTPLFSDAWSRTNYGNTNHCFVIFVLTAIINSLPPIFSSNSVHFLLPSHMDCIVVMTTILGNLFNLEYVYRKNKLTPGVHQWFASLRTCLKYNRCCFRVW